MLSKNRTKSRGAYREPKRKFPSGKTQTLSPVPFVLLLRAALQRNLLCHLLEVVTYIGRWWVNKRIAGVHLSSGFLTTNCHGVNTNEAALRPWTSGSNLDVCHHVNTFVNDHLSYLIHESDSIIMQWPSVISDSQSDSIIVPRSSCHSRHVWFTIRFNNCSMTIASCLINNQIQ